MSANVDSFRKAAILVATLDRDSADALLEQLPEEQAQIVRNTVLALDSIDPDEQERVLAEFFGGRVPALEDQNQPGDAASEAAGGVELDAGLLERLAEENAQQEQGDRAIATRALRNPFDFLEEIDCQALVRVLAQEHPQAVAVVLAHLPRGKAAAVVAAFEEALQIEVLRRLAYLDDADEAALRDLEDHLRDLLADHLRRSARHQAGMEVVADILQAVGAEQHDSLVARLRHRDSELAGVLLSRMERTTAGGPAAAMVPGPSPERDAAAEQDAAAEDDAAHFVTGSAPPASAASAAYSPWPGGQWNPGGSNDSRSGSPWLRDPAAATATNREEEGTFSGAGSRTIFKAHDGEARDLSLHDLAELSAESIRILLRASDADVLMLALVGAPPRLVDRFCDPFPAREAAALRKALDHLGPTRLDDVATAQRRLIQLALRLEQEGRIALTGPRLSMAA